MCHLLFHHLGGQTAAVQEVWDVQEPVSLELLVQMVQVQQLVVVSSLSEPIQLWVRDSLALVPSQDRGPRPRAAGLMKEHRARTQYHHQFRPAAQGRRTPRASPQLTPGLAPLSWRCLVALSTAAALITASYAAGH